MIHDEYTDEELNQESLRKTPGIGQENYIPNTHRPYGTAKYRDANWME